MPVGTGARSGRPAVSVRCRLEPLEDRFLPSGSPITDLGNNATLDQAQALGTLAAPLAVTGAVDNTSANPADAHWYAFDLARPADVALSASAAAGQSPPVLSLYNSDTSDFSDQYDPLGHRLVAQAAGSGNGTSDLSQPLAAGTYYVAVSGAGNLNFNPFLADSGYPGIPCTYTLTLTETDLPLQAGDGPVVMASTPAAGQQLDRSPLVIRLSLSNNLDPTTLQPDQTVRLTYNPTGDFGNANDVDVPLAGVNFTPEASELQLTPMAALAPGYYQVFLAGDKSNGQPVIADLNETPLGQNADHPNGQDFVETFQVTGIDGNVGPAAASDDTAATSRDLGDVTGVQLVQTAGTIGDDPAYNPNNLDPNLTNPAAQVDLYHFRVTGPGVHQLTAEVFAGRIGSPLDPGVSLFGVDPSTGQLTLIAANDNSLNDQPATNGTAPLFNDPVLFAGLTAGDYYLAVSGTGNVPDPTEGQAVGVNGVFDPNIAYSGMNGFTTGDYVLNLQVGRATTPPQVVTVSVAEGAQLNGPPGLFTVQFSEPVNLPQLAETAFQQSPDLTLNAVYVQGSDGKQYHARLSSYDPTHNQATFLLLDAVPGGAAELHLSGSGSLGLTDLAGNPLVGSGDPSGDYVVDFTVGGPPRGTNGNPLLWLATTPNDTLQSPQVLGVLFPDELQSGVVVQRTSAQPPPTNGADYFQFQVLQARQNFLTLTGTGLAKGALPTVTDADGNTLIGIPQGRGGAVRFDLTPGTYVVSVGGWTAAQASSVQYTLKLALATGGDNPPALTVGPAPAIRVRYADMATTPTPTPTPTPPPDNNPPQDNPPVNNDPQGNTSPVQVVSAPTSSGRASTSGSQGVTTQNVGPTPASATTPTTPTPTPTPVPTAGSTFVVAEKNVVSVTITAPAAPQAANLTFLPAVSVELLLPRSPGTEGERTGDVVSLPPPQVTVTVTSVGDTPATRTFLISAGSTTAEPQPAPQVVAQPPSVPASETVTDRGTPPSSLSGNTSTSRAHPVVPASVAGPALDSLFELNPLALRFALSSVGFNALAATDEANAPQTAAGFAGAATWTEWAARLGLGVTLALAGWYAYTLRHGRRHTTNDDLLQLLTQ
jgi:hypothetical protein